MEFNIFDLINIVIIIVSISFGLYKGFIKSILSLISAVFLIILTGVLFTFINPLANDYIHKPIVANALSGVGAFLVSLVLTSVTYAKFIEFIKNVRGGTIDRIFGALFGALRGLLISSFIFISSAILTTDNLMNNKNIKEFTDNLNIEQFPSWITEAVTYKMLFESTKTIIEIIPQKYLDNLLKMEFLDKNDSKYFNKNEYK